MGFLYPVGLARRRSKDFWLPATTILHERIAFIRPRHSWRRALGSWEAVAQVTGSSGRSRALAVAQMHGTGNLLSRVLAGRGVPADYDVLILAKSAKCEKFC
jgi:hypothetical protein